MYSLDFFSILKYLPALLKGLYLTFEITIIVFIFGTIFGIIFSFLRFSKIYFVRFFIKSIISLFISLPVLVILFWLYYALPIFTGFTFQLILQ